MAVQIVNDRFDLYRCNKATKMLVTKPTMRSYRHLIFDLDHTLWDFKKNSEETLRELYDYYRLTDIGSFSAQQLCTAFEQVNLRLWQLYNEGKYDQQRLRSERFRMIFAHLGVAAHRVPANIADEYLSRCPTKPHVLPHTIATLDYLRARYRLHILTNGFAEVQAIKLSSAQLSSYFTEVIASDTTGHRKPHRPVFDYTLSRIRARPDECIMIGDNLDTDIRGAREAGIDQIYFNPEQQTHQESATYEIACLSELRRIL